MTVEELRQALSEASPAYDPNLSDDSLERICRTRFRGTESYVLAAILSGLALDNQPLTVRALFYRAVSVGLFPSTASRFYDKVGRMAVRLRRAGLIPYQWIVDNLRSTQKPSSWSGLDDYADTVSRVYRKDFWSTLPEYVHIICEKDAVSGTIVPVTREYDVPLSPIRGYISDSFAWELGDTWRRIRKPVHVYYVGDFDPSGFDLEANARRKLTEFADREISWTRLGVLESDFDAFGLVELAVKLTDARSRAFLDQHGSRCAEVDAIPPPELRGRVRAAIEQHIPEGEWARLKAIEQQERATFNEVMSAFSSGGRGGDDAPG